MIQLLTDLQISGMLLDYSGYEWEKCDAGWLDLETQLVFTEKQVIEMLAATTMQLCGFQKLVYRKKGNYL